MNVDEDQKFVLEKHSKVKGVVKEIKSDHNPIYLTAKLPWDGKVKKPSVEIFNLRNKECPNEYFRFTNTSDVLTKCLIDRDILKFGGKMWLKSMKNIIQTYFRKIRINRKNPHDVQIQNLFDKQTLMRQIETGLSEND